MSSDCASLKGQSLPSHCLEHILAFVAPNDIRTIHACVLVSREWCEPATRALWGRPFAIVEKFCSDRRTYDRNRAKTLFGVLLARVDVSALQSSGLARHLVPRETTFDYLSFVVGLQCGGLYVAVRAWIAGTKDNDNDRNSGTSRNHNTDITNTTITNANSNIQARAMLWEQPLFAFMASNAGDDSDSSGNHFDGYAAAVTTHVAKIIAGSGPRLRSLTVEPCGPSPVPTFRMKECIEETGALHILTEFTWTCQPANIDVFTALAKVARQIRRICVWHLVDTAPLQSVGLVSPLSSAQWVALAQLVRVQRGLVELEIGYGSIATNEILAAACTQASTLRRLAFRNINFDANDEPLTDLAALKMLRRLSFIDCKGLGGYHLRPLAAAKLPKLIDLDISDTAIPSSVQSSLMANLGATLESITLGGSPGRSDNELCQMQRMLATYCRRLTHYSSFLDPSRVKGFLQVVDHCRSLRSVSLQGNSTDASCLLYALGRHRPSRLHHLRLAPSWYFSSASLGHFLRNAQPPLRSFSCGNVQPVHLQVVLAYLGRTLQSLHVDSYDGYFCECLKAAAAKVIDSEPWSSRAVECSG